MFRKLGNALLGMLMVTNLAVFGIFLKSDPLSALPFMSCDPVANYCKCFHFEEWDIHQCVNLGPQVGEDECVDDSMCQGT